MVSAWPAASYEDWRATCDTLHAALGFGRSAFSQACVACGWDIDLAATAEGTPPPVR
jgi:hypothetical protein